MREEVRVRERKSLEMRMQIKHNGFIQDGLIIMPSGCQLCQLITDKYGHTVLVVGIVCALLVWIRLHITEGRPTWNNRGVRSLLIAIRTTESQNPTTSKILMHWHQAQAVSCWHWISNLCRFATEAASWKREMCFYHCSSVSLHQRWMDSGST